MNDMTITKDYAFPVEMKHIHASGDINIPSTMARALVRTDTNEALGVHGSKYEYILHDDVVTSIQTAVMKSNISKIGRAHV